MNFNFNPAALKKLIVPILTILVCTTLGWISWELYNTAYYPLVTQANEVVAPTEFTIPKAKIERARQDLKDRTAPTELESFNNPFSLEQ